MNDPLFKAMEPTLRKKILKGKSAMYLNRLEITKKYCDNYKMVDALYKVLSNHVHSGIYDLVYISSDKSKFGCDSVNNRRKIVGLLYLVNYYVGLAITSILTLYPDKVRHIPRKSVNLIRHLVSRF
jgi:hypothetical protein